MKVLIGGMLIWAANNLPAQEEPFAEAEKDAILEQIATLIQKTYAFPELGKEISEKLRSEYSSGAFSSAREPVDLAAQLTAGLKDIRLEP